MSAPDWLTPGAKVAVVRDDFKRTGIAPVYATVDRVMKRDVVLDDGQRFPVRDLRLREGGAWGWTLRLLPAEDPIVIETQAKADHAVLVSTAKTACDHFRYDRQPRMSAAEVILALAPLTGVADEIRALFANPEEKPRD